MTDDIGVLFVKDSFNDSRPEIVNESLAGRLYDSIKHGTKLLQDKLSHIFSMVGHVVLDNSGQDSAKGTFIIKSVLAADEVSTRALLMDMMQFEESILVVVYPIFLLKGRY